MGMTVEKMVDELNDILKTPNMPDNAYARVKTAAKNLDQLRATQGNHAELCRKLNGVLSGLDTPTGKPWKIEAPEVVL